MIIYCRHGDDETPDSPYAHDNHLVKGCRESCQRKAERLVAKYGQPTVVFCSPFLRARETLKAMWPALSGPHGKPRVVIDPALSRHFSSREQKRPSVSPSTREVDIPIYETWAEFEERCRAHMRGMAGDGHYRARDVVWCITHVLVLKQVAKTFGVSLPKHVPFLGHFSAALQSERALELRRERRKKAKRRLASDSSDASPGGKFVGHRHRRLWRGASGSL